MLTSKQPIISTHHHRCPVDGGLEMRNQDRSLGYVLIPVGMRSNPHLGTSYSHLSWRRGDGDAIPFITSRAPIEVSSSWYIMQRLGGRGLCHSCNAGRALNNSF